MSRVAESGKSSTLDHSVAQNEETEDVVPMSLRVRPETKALIEGIRERTGVSATQVASRLLDWYATMPPELRQAIMTREAPVQSALVLSALVQMAGISGRLSELLIREILDRGGQGGGGRIDDRRPKR
jgi:hypothetical protein